MIAYHLNEVNFNKVIFCVKLVLSCMHLQMTHQLKRRKKINQTNEAEFHPSTPFVVQGQDREPTLPLRHWWFPPQTIEKVANTFYLLYNCISEFKIVSIRQYIVLKTLHIHIIPPPPVIAVFFSYLFKNVSIKQCWSVLTEKVESKVMASVLFIDFTVVRQSVTFK